MTRRVVDVHVLDNSCRGKFYPGFRERIELPETLEEYHELWTYIDGFRERGEVEGWRALMRLWSAGDAYFRLVFVLTPGRDAWSKHRGEPHFWHPVHIEISRWVQFGDHNREYLVASRGIGKSTELTLNDDIGRKLIDPNDASCVFSHTREFAGKHGAVKKNELETNDLLKGLWPDRFWQDPQKEAPSWGIVEGLTIMRSSTRMEPSFSVHAFVYKLPVGMHFDKRYYDDIEEEQAVGSEEMMAKIESQFISSQDLSSSKRERAITGTYYHPAGLMRRLETERGMKAMIFPCEDLSDKPPAEEAGPFGGRPINGFTREDCFEVLEQKGGVASVKARRSYAFQNLCDPRQAEPVRLDPAFIGYYDVAAAVIATRCNLYVCLDPSPGRDNPSWLWVWGAHEDGRVYWLDSWRKRLSPGRRNAEVYLSILHWQQVSGGRVRQVRIEDYGQAGASEGQLEYNTERGLYLPIVKCADPSKHKMDRAFERWDPALTGDRIRFPRQMMREDQDGEVLDLVAYFIERELKEFPRPVTDDGLDAGGLGFDAKAGSMEHPRPDTAPEEFEPEEEFGPEHHLALGIY